MQVSLDCFGLTDVGRVRKNNEDHFLIADLTKRLHIQQTSLPTAHTVAWTSGLVGYLFVVADGMGGRAGGEVASGLAVEAVSWYVTRTMPWFYRYQDGREPQLEAELKGALETSEKTVREAARSSRFHLMGTTLTMAYVLWPRLYVVHAGDSRCYLHRGGVMQQLTTDHTVAQQAVDKGIFTLEQAERSGLGHALWNCIGGGADGVTPELYHTTLAVGDELLLCTDGLTRRLTDNTIRDILLQEPTSERAVGALVSAANAAGGEDNITAVVARVRPPADANRTPADGTAFMPKV